MDIRQYESYFANDEPIPYIPRSCIEIRNSIENEIASFRKLIGSNDEQNQIVLQRIKELEYRYSKLIIYIHPAKVQNYLDFHFAINCITIDKNRTPDINIIKMKYLDFIFQLINQENGEVYAHMLSRLLKICFNLGDSEIKYIRDNENIKLVLGNIVCNWEDFDDIRRIICYQNILEYDETYIDPKLDKALKEAEAFISRNKKKTCLFEEQKICLWISANATLDEINNLTLRKFSMALRRVDHKLHYEIYRQASMSGMVEFKSEIDHWMCEIKIDKYSGLITEYGGFQEKMSKVT